MRFLGAFFIVLFVLKVVDVLNWSWLFVTAPLWGVPALFAVILAFCVVVQFICFALTLLIDVAMHPRSFREVRRRRKAIRKLVSSLDSLRRGLRR